MLMSSSRRFETLYDSVMRASPSGAPLGRMIALTIAIKDIPRISATDSPVALILRDQLGPVMESALLVAIVIAFFGAGLVTLTTCARMVFAMSRLHNVAARVR